MKDNYDVAGLPTTANSRQRLDHVATRDAGPVARLKAAGAICLGKLSTWEYGTGNGGEYGDTVFPTTRNPGTSRVSPAAPRPARARRSPPAPRCSLSARTRPLVRLPAAACGVVGVKATPGRIIRHGLLPNCWSLDIPGPFTWTVEDAAIVLGAIAGYDPSDPITEDVPVPDYPRFLAGG